jgi:hypothetical protein
MLLFSTCPIVGLPEKVTSFEDKGPFSSSPAPIWTIGGDQDTVNAKSHSAAFGRSP